LIFEICASTPASVLAVPAKPTTFPARVIGAW
jgi:hypothetical protein